jgi:hypothetical protein
MRSHELVPFSAIAGLKSEVETIPDDHFRDQVIGGARHANPQAEIDLPFERKVQINGRENLVLLLIQREESGYRPDRAVIFRFSS